MSKSMRTRVLEAKWDIIWLNYMRSRGPCACGSSAFGPMIQHWMWRLIAADNPHVMMCQPCIEERLGRPIEDSDLIECPWNYRLKTNGGRLA